MWRGEKKEGMCGVIKEIQGVEEKRVWGGGGGRGSRETEREGLVMKM